jgi:endogenous inhibitor of DNA gyrase (YacG/DUF329 family)
MKMEGGMPLGACAMCGKPAVEKFAPFCSSRCATLDLGRWLGEGYRVPAKEEEPDEDFRISVEKREDGR